jgi:hypothetical protein
MPAKRTKKRAPRAGVSRRKNPARLRVPVPDIAVARAHTPTAGVEKSNQTPQTTTSSPAGVSASAPPAVVNTVALESTTSAYAEPTAMPDALSQATVTITGCLETSIDEDQFRLTDTEGADAPKARSWRSGFLKKHTEPVALVNVSKPLGLRKYVGRRVVAMGLLTNRELHVRSVQPAGTSCS